VSWHVLNIVVVSNNGVCVAAGLISLLEPLSKQPGIFLIKEKEDSEKAAFFFGVFPETFKSLALRKIFLDADFAPVAKAVFVAP